MHGKSRGFLQEFVGSCSEIVDVVKEVVDELPGGYLEVTWKLIARRVESIQKLPSCRLEVVWTLSASCPGVVEMLLRNCSGTK